MVASDSLLTIPDYQLWYQQMQGSESRIYANLTARDYDRYQIIEDLQQINGFRLPEYQFKRDLFLHALMNQLSEEEEEPYDTLPILSTAYTPAWLGTAAVFLSRAIAEEEVDDEELGLRVSAPTKDEVTCQLTANIAHSDLVVNSMEAYTIELYSTDGSLLLKKALPVANRISLQSYSEIGFYKIYSDKCVISGKWILVK